MQITPPSRESLLRYLLHEIDEQEREQIDALLIADADYEEQFCEVDRPSGRLGCGRVDDRRSRSGDTCSLTEEPF